MKTIYLRRQGTSDTYNTNNAINSQMGFIINVVTCPNNYYRISIVAKRDTSTDEATRKRIEINQQFTSLPNAFRRIEKEIQKEFGEEITISDTIEMYCHANYNCDGDKYLAVCFYEKSTETIRLYPENYCLVSFKNKDTKDYLQMDAATAQYLPILEKQAKEYENEKNWHCHKNKFIEFIRERFAWLIGEDIKESNNEVKFYIADSLIK